MSLVDELRARRGDPDDPGDPAYRASAEREHARNTRRRDAEHARAYKHGREGTADGSEYDHDPELRGSFDSGSEYRRHNGDDRPAKPSGSSGRRPAALSPPSFVSDGSGFLLGLIGYALVLNYIRGGPAAVRGWLAAKFLNRPYSGPTLAPITPLPPKPPDFGTGRANGTGDIVWRNFFPGIGGDGVTR